jgi:Transglutaminase-like superfamily
MPHSNPNLAPLARRLSWPLRVARLGPRVWLDLARAIFELGIARWKLGAQTIAQMRPSTIAEMDAVSRLSLTDEQREQARRVSFAIVQAGARVPWRSDCLVQALAARRWLAGAGIDTALCIGVRSEALGFEAHAWLIAGDLAVTGGDSSSYAPFAIPAVTGRIAR